MLAEKGCNVVVNYTKSEKEARQTVTACENHGAETILCKADVAQDDDCRRMVDETARLTLFEYELVLLGRIPVRL